VVTAHAPADLAKCDRNVDLLVRNRLTLAILLGSPTMALQDWGSLLVTLVLVSLTAVSMGLLASAAVHNAAQATLALPMLCFPQVLFAGAVVSVTEMAGAGRFMSFGMANRWGFESLARTLDLRSTISTDTGTAGYADAFSGSPSAGWTVLALLTVAMLAVTTTVLDRRCRPAPMRSR